MTSEDKPLADKARSKKAEKPGKNRKDRRFSRFGLAARVTGAVAILLFIGVLYLLLGPPADMIASSLLTSLVEKHFAPGSGFQTLDLDLRSGELRITGIWLEVPPAPADPSVAGGFSGPCSMSLESLRFAFGPSFDRWTAFGAQQLDLEGLDVVLDQDSLMAFVDRHRRKRNREPREVSFSLPGVTIRRSTFRYGRREIPLDIDVQNVVLSLAPTDSSKVIEGVLHCGPGVVDADDYRFPVDGMEASLGLDTGGLRVRYLSLTSPEAELTAHGVIGFRRYGEVPRRLTIEGTCRLDRVENYTRLPFDLVGTAAVDLELNGKWGEPDETGLWILAGTVSGDQAWIADLPLDDYTILAEVGSDGLTVHRFDTGLFEGRCRGAGSLAPLNTHGVLEATLELDRVSLPLAQPLFELGEEWPDGLVSGQVAGTVPVDSWFDVVAAGELELDSGLRKDILRAMGPPSARGRVSFHTFQRTLHLQESVLNVGQTAIRFSGPLSLEGGDIRINIRLAADDLRRSREVLELVLGPRYPRLRNGVGDVPLFMAGALELDATMVREDDGPLHFAGWLRGDGLDLAGFSLGGTDGRFHIDTDRFELRDLIFDGAGGFGVRGRVDYFGWQLGQESETGAAGITPELVAAGLSPILLDEMEPPPHPDTEGPLGPLNPLIGLRCDLENVPLDTVCGLLPMPPVSGEPAEVKLALDRVNPFAPLTGWGLVESDGWDLDPWRLGHTVAGVGVDGNGIRWHGEIGGGNGRMTVSGWIEPGFDDVHFRFNGSAVELPGACTVLVDEETGEPYFRAPLHFTGHGSYDQDRYSMRIGFDYPWLVSGANLVGPGRGSIALEGDFWRLELEPEEGSGRIHGLLFGDGHSWPLWMAGELSSLRVRQCEEGAAVPQSIPGQWADLTGTVWLQGPAAFAHRLVLGGQVEHCLVSTSENYRLESHGAFPILIDQGVRSLKLPRATFQGPAGSQISAGGRLAFEGANSPTDMLLLGSFDLDGLGISSELFQLSGSGLAELHLGGYYPLLTQTGRVDLTGGKLTLPEIHFACTDIEASVALEPDRLELLNIEGRVGGGPVSGSGTLHYGEDYSAQTFRFEATGRDLVLAYPEKVSTLFDADLVLEGDREGHTLSGRGLIRRTVYSGSVFLEEEVTVPVEDPAAVVETGDDWLGRMALDLTLVAPDNLFIRSEEGTVQFTGSLEVGQTFADPRITGTVTTVPGGRFLFRDIEYDVEEARVDFVDPTGVQPVLYLKASTTVDTYLITLVADGPFEDLSFQVTSVPRLNDRDIISLLAFGRLSSELPGIESATLAGQEVTSYFTGGFTGELQARLKETFGLTRFEIQPMFLEGTTDPTARITVGKDLSDDLFFTYSTSLTSIEDTLLLLRYRIDERLAILASREQDGSYGGDFQYRTSMSFAQGKNKSLRDSLFGRTGRRSPEEEAAAADGAPRPLVGDVSFADRDNLPPKQEALARKLKMKPGETLEGKREVDDRERLTKYLIKRGHLRCRVSVDRLPREAVEDEQPVVDLVWTVDAGPRYRVDYSGGRVPLGLKGKIRKLWSGAAFFDDNIRRAREMLIGHFRGKGFPDVEVEAEQPPPEDGDQRTALVFRVEKGSAARIGAIEVSGNRMLTGEDVAGLLEGDPEQFQLKAGASYVEEQVLQALARVRSAYLSRGYNGCRLTHLTGPPANGSPGDDVKTVPLRITITEGPPDVVSRIQFAGLNGLNEIDLRNRFIYREGEPYDASLLKTAEDDLVRYIDQEGFVDARLKIEVRAEDGGGDGPVPHLIVVSVGEGRRHLVDHWRFTGNVLTDNRVIRQEMEVRPGEPLSRFGMLQSQRNLYRTGLFDQVVIRYEPLPGPVDGPLNVRLLVEMEERDNLQLTGGVGYDTEESIRGYLQFNNLNFMGARRILGLQLRGSSRRQRLQVTGTETRFLNRDDMEATVVAFAAREEEESYDISRLSASFQVDWEYSPRWRFLYGYNFEANRLDEVRVEEDVIEDREETFRISRLRLSPIYDARDDIFNPTRGLFISGELGTALKELGSEVEFLRSLFSGSYHKPLSRRTIWLSSLRLGLMGWPGSEQYIPLSERFYAGGSSTVRGFPYDRLGPLDPKTGLPLGGEALVVINQELQFPLFGDLGASVFLDWGNVFPKVSDMFNDFDLRSTAGLGLRYRTPVGPVRMEYGWVLDRREGEGRGEFYLSIGNAF